MKYLLTKKAYDQKRLEKAIRKTSYAAVAGESACGNGGGSSSSSSATGHGAGDDDDVEVMEVERTELELATEATVVRAKGTGRQARKELRQSMARYSSTVQYEGSSANIIFCWCKVVLYDTNHGGVAVLNNSLSLAYSILPWSGCLFYPLPIAPPGVRFFGLDGATREIMCGISWQRF